MISGTSVVTWSIISSWLLLADSRPSNVPLWLVLYPHYGCNFPFLPAGHHEPTICPRDSSAHPGPKPVDLELEDVEAEGRSCSTRDIGPKRQNLLETPGNHAFWHQNHRCFLSNFPLIQCRQSGSGRWLSHSFHCFRREAEKISNRQPKVLVRVPNRARMQQ